MKHVTFPLPLAGLTIRFEFLPAARPPSVFPVRAFLIPTSLEKLKSQLDDRLLRDIGLDRSRCD